MRLLRGRLGARAAFTPLPGCGAAAFESTSSYVPNCDAAVPLSSDKQPPRTYALFIDSALVVGSFLILTPNVPERSV